MPVDAPSSAESGLNFWAEYQPGFRFSNHAPGTPEFFRDVERHRYELEPHIPEIARFAHWQGRDVLEVGCGIATDGIRFARAGARYRGVDASETAIELAQRRFDSEQARGSFTLASATALPFEDESFDLVYSHGVIHHIDDTQGAVEEFHRVLKPGGVALVMLYHRNSLNYYLTIMGVRRVLASALLVPRADRLIAAITKEEPEVLAGHRALLQRYGLRYLLDRQLFLSNNTDGPGNPLSKVYSRRDAKRLFHQFRDVAVKVRYPNLRLYPGGSAIERSPVGSALGRRLGWHLYVLAAK